MIESDTDWRLRGWQCTACGSNSTTHFANASAICAVAHKNKGPAEPGLLYPCSPASGSFGHRHEEILADAIAEQVDAIHEVLQPLMQAVFEYAPDPTVVQLGV